MTKQRSDGGDERQMRPVQQTQRRHKAPPATGVGVANRRLAEQTRKLLGRHYAAKYPGRRSG